MSDQTNDAAREVDGKETTGHSWDGIQEFNNPLPRWWLWCFYLTIIWGIGYTIAYPAWPLINRATAGVLGFSTRAEVAADIAAVDAANAALEARLAAVDLNLLGEDPELEGYARNAGAAIFRNNCAQCHGAGGNGSSTVGWAPGYPSLIDDDWLWGSSIEEVAYTITHGIRNEQSFDSRWTEMPAYGEFFTDEEIAQVVEYALSLSGADHDAALAAPGMTIFADNCAACHGAEGLGDPDQGAPNIADSIWLYGGSREAVTETVTNARFGVMPAWGEEFRAAQGLSPSEINAVAAYVKFLEGGN